MVTVDCDVAIIGAGFSGVSAARDLQRLGISASIFEARDRIGGRTWYKPQALAGMDLEMGGTWIDPRQAHSWREAHAYGVRLGPPIYGSPPTTWRLGGELRQGRLPVSTDAIGDLERIAHRMFADAMRIDVNRGLREQQVSDLDISLTEYIDGIGVRSDSREAARVYLAAYGSAPPEQVSALHILRRMAAAGSISEFVMSGASHPFVGGTAALLQAMLAESGSSVHLETPVLSITQNEKEIVLNTPSGDVRSRAAILTVPVNVWGSIECDPPLSESKQALASEEIASRGVKVWMIVEGAPVGFSACGTGDGLEMVWTEQVLGKRRSLVVGYGLDADRIDTDDPAALERAVRAFLPEASVVESCGHDWRNDPWARETWAVFKPGQIKNYEHNICEPEGRLFIAGSATARRWPGFIDGAIESGGRVANEVAGMSKHTLPHGRAASQSG
jgi:monoamine oxidase